MANRGRSPAARFQFGIRMMDGSSRRESAQTSPAGIMSGLTSAATKRHQKGQIPISGPNPCFELVPRHWLFTIVPDLGYQFIQLVHHRDGRHAGFLPSAAVVKDSFTTESSANSLSSNMFKER